MPLLTHKGRAECLYHKAANPKLPQAEREDIYSQAIAEDRLVFSRGVLITGEAFFHSASRQSESRLVQKAQTSDRNSR